MELVVWPLWQVQLSAANQIQILISCDNFLPIPNRKCKFVCFQWFLACQMAFWSSAVADQLKSPKRSGSGVLQNQLFLCSSYQPTSTPYPVTHLGCTLQRLSREAAKEDWLFSDDVPSSCGNRSFPLLTLFLYGLCIIHYGDIQCTVARYSLLASIIRTYTVKLP